MNKFNDDMDFDFEGMKKQLAEANAEIVTDENGDMKIEPKKENEWEGRNLHELLEPNKLYVAIKGELDSWKTEAAMKKSFEKWLEGKSKKTTQ